MFISFLSNWQIVHSPRETNSAAHGLAKAAVKYFIDDIWLVETPTFICDVILLEQTV